MDFGDLIFLIIFVIAIINSIFKQKKKSAAKAGGKGKPKKKPAWKQAFDTMLEEARKQMEIEAEPSPSSKPGRQPSGWDDIVSVEDIVTEPPAPKKAVKKPLLHQEPVLKKSSFRPDCMNCNSSMKEIQDFGTRGQKGLLYCDTCGEQHKYNIDNGELNLVRADMLRKSGQRATGRKFLKTEKEEYQDKKQPVVLEQEPATVHKDTGFPKELSASGLRNAVVWAEILRTPLGLRDLEGH